MAGVWRSKDTSRKPRGPWRFWFIDYRGKRKSGTGTDNKSKTLAAARKLEQEHREIRMGYRPAKDAAIGFKEFGEAIKEYINWGETQGGRGGKPWGKTHAASRRRHLPWWQEQLQLNVLFDLDGKVASAEKALQALSSNGLKGKTLSNYAESLCAFCDWCVKRAYLSIDPMKDLGRFDNTPVDTRRSLTREEVQG